MKKSKIQEPEKVKKPVGRPPRTDKDNSSVKTVEKGTKPGEARKTYILGTVLIKKIDGISFWENRSIKEVVSEALTDFVNKWEKKNGPVKMPESK